MRIWDVYLESVSLVLSCFNQRECLASFVTKGAQICSNLINRHSVNLARSCRFCALWPFIFHIILIILCLHLRIDSLNNKVYHIEKINQFKWKRNSGTIYFSRVRPKTVCMWRHFQLLKNLIEKLSRNFSRRIILFYACIYGLILWIIIRLIACYKFDKLIGATLKRNIKWR
jgi:hypothetical protein